MIRGKPLPTLQNVIVIIRHNLKTIVRRYVCVYCIQLHMCCRKGNGLFPIPKINASQYIPALYVLASLVDRGMLRSGVMHAYYWVILIA